MCCKTRVAIALCCVEAVGEAKSVVLDIGVQLASVSKVAKIGFWGVFQEFSFSMAKFNIS